MSLAERLSEMKPKDPGLPCGIARISKDLSDEDRASLEAVMFAENRIISNAQLHELLIDEGYDVSYSSISLHRRRQCRCFKGRKERLKAAAQ